jgi:hypothetical protein
LVPFFLGLGVGVEEPLPLLGGSQGRGKFVEMTSFFEK